LVGRHALQPPHGNHPLGVLVFQRSSLRKTGCLVRGIEEAKILPVVGDLELTRRDSVARQDPNPDIALARKVHEDATAYR